MVKKTTSKRIRTNILEYAVAYLPDMTDAVVSFEHNKARALFSTFKQVYSSTSSPTEPNDVAHVKIIVMPEHKPDAIVKSISGYASTFAKAFEEMHAQYVVIQVPCYIADCYEDSKDIKDAMSSVDKFITEITSPGYQYTDMPAMFKELLRILSIMSAAKLAGLEVFLCNCLLPDAVSPQSLSIPKSIFGLPVIDMNPAIDASTKAVDDLLTNINNERLAEACATTSKNVDIDEKPILTCKDTDEIAVAFRQYAHNDSVMNKFAELNNMRDAVYNLAKSQGRYDMKPSIASLLMHMSGEVNEAHDAYMSDSHSHKEDTDVLHKLMQDCNDNVFRKYFKSAVKSTFEDEVADMTLMCLSIAGYYGIDLAKHVAMKHKYNELRTEHSYNNDYAKI